MFKFISIKKNKLPTVRDLHPEPAAPGLIWSYILGIALACSLITGAISAYVFWHIFNEDSFTSVGDNLSATTDNTVNTDRLQKAYEAINSRDASI